MIKRFRIVAVCICCVLALAFTGCSVRLVDFTIISTKNIDLAKGASFKRGQLRVTGQDSVCIIIIIPTGVPNIKTAIDRAIQSVPGAVALLDGVVTSKMWYIPYIFGKSTYVVEGTPLIDPSISTAELQSNHIISRLDNKGNVVEIRYVSKTEYEAVKKKIGI